MAAVSHCSSLPTATWTSGPTTPHVGSWNRVTFDSGDDIFPIWSPDDSRIAFGSRRGQMDLYWKLLTGPPGSEELLLSSAQPKFPRDWSPDGRFLLYDTITPMDSRTSGRFPWRASENHSRWFKRTSTNAWGSFRPMGSGLRTSQTRLVGSRFTCGHFQVRETMCRCPPMAALRRIGITAARNCSISPWTTD